ncbi:MAG: peptidase C15, partial [Bacillota bacterium]|nr:peptidase C15 [Bacillota bacterium]
DDGPDGYFSTLPIRKFVQTLQENGYPAEISNSAGTYLCNNVMYQLLHKINSEKKDCISGFVHIPASHQLALHKSSLPSWPQKDLIDAVKVMIASL